MKQLYRRVLCVVFVLTIAVFAVYFVFDRTREKNTPPTLSCESESFSASIHDGPAALLAGVTATDKEDGDLTDRVLVESISRFVTRGVCHVTYAVQDSDNAVAKLTRTLTYTDYTAPTFSITAPLVFDYGRSFDPSSVVQATDCIDGDISENVRMTLLSDETSIAGVGVWPVQFRVTNSKGETAKLTANVTVQELSTTEKRYTPNVRLKQYLVYLPVGAAFDPADYVSGVSVAAEDAPDNAAELRARLRNNSTVDTAKAGVYTVTYRSTSSNGYTGSAELIVVVGDGES